MMPRVSIITVNYNGQKYLKNFFGSLKNLDYPNFEVIFLDNASKDGSIKTVKKVKQNKEIENIKIIENKANLGFAAGNNQGAKYAEGKYLFFLNNDTKVEPKSVSLLVRQLERNPKIKILGCRMMNYSGQRHFHTGIGMDIFGYPILKGEAFYAEGSALMIENKFFEKMGGFDADYFMFHEDIDLAWRVWLQGYQVAALPEAVVYHCGGGTAGGGEKRGGRYRSSYLRRYYSERNNIRTLLKNYQLKTLFLIMPLYFLINLAEIIFCLVTLKFKVVFLYLKAYLWNLVNLKSTFKLRAKIQETRTLADRQLLKKMYFGSGKLYIIKKTGIPVFQ